MLSFSVLTFQISGIFIKKSFSLKILNSAVRSGLFARRLKNISVFLSQYALGHNFLVETRLFGYCGNTASGARKNKKYTPVYFRRAGLFKCPGGSNALTADP